MATTPAAPAVTFTFTGSFKLNGIDIPVTGVGTLNGTPQITFTADSGTTSDSQQTADQS